MQLCQQILLLNELSVLDIEHRLSSHRVNQTTKKKHNLAYVKLHVNLGMQIT